MADVGVILGSRSDLPLMEDCQKQLDQLGLSQELTICSAHRNPQGVVSAPGPTTFPPGR